MRAYPKLSSAENLRGWLLTIANRKAIDHFRAAQRRAVPVADVPPQAVTDPLPTDNGVWAHVRKLPPKQRTALALRFIADAAYAEISTVMDTSEEAARRNVHEGLKRLRLEYEHA
jgi:DNA-directed RNA polymerase specialized sigma24 family protein